jgi:PLP dependent protein
VIKENIVRIRQRIYAACNRAGRDLSEIAIVAVTKNRGIQEIKEALENGLADIGENRVQEALLKYSQLSVGCWHLIGHLQTNKAKDAVKIFGLIHSLDSLRLAEEIDKQAVKISKVQDVLLEVNVSGEATKFGVKPDEAAGLIGEISGLKNIRVKGLMTIAPVSDNPQASRPYFRQLRELRDKIGGLEILSMGMTDDFEAAIEEGATMVRIGRAIFEG